jgi:hypothetical protein
MGLEKEASARLCDTYAKTVLNNKRARFCIAYFCIC